MACSAVFVACKGTDNKKQETVPADTTQNINSVSNIPAANPANTAPVNNGAAQAQTANAGTAKLNPAHGEPGHDCAIPVGAPLDGSGGKAPQAATLTQDNAAPANPSVSAEGKKLNPAHGQPGHDCAVPVGAPLG